MERDPCTDPAAGDELVIFPGGSVRWYRRVIAVYGGVSYVTNAGTLKWMPLDRWREQMRNAVHPGEARVRGTVELAYWSASLKRYHRGRPVISDII